MKMKNNTQSNRKLFCDINSLEEREKLLKLLGSSNINNLNNPVMASYLNNTIIKQLPQEEFTKAFNLDYTKKNANDILQSAFCMIIRCYMNDISNQIQMVIRFGKEIAGRNVLQELTNYRFIFLSLIFLGIHEVNQKQLYGNKQIDNIVKDPLAISVLKKNNLLIEKDNINYINEEAFFKLTGLDEFPIENDIDRKKFNIVLTYCLISFCIKEASNLFKSIIDNLI